MATAMPIARTRLVPLPAEMTVTLRPRSAAQSTRDQSVRFPVHVVSNAPLVHGHAFTSA